MVTLVSIKLRGESNIIDDNPTMKQADEMSLKSIQEQNNFNVFSIFNVLILKVYSDWWRNLGLSFSLR